MMMFFLFACSFMHRDNCYAFYFFSFILQAFSFTLFSSFNSSLRTLFAFSLHTHTHTCTCSHTLIIIIVFVLDLLVSSFCLATRPIGWPCVTETYKHWLFVWIFFFGVHHMQYTVCMGLCVYRFDS